MEYLQLISIGIVTGIFSSFFGVGGGVIIVPALLFIYPTISYTSVIGCSFGIIFLNSIINTYYFKKLNLSLPNRFYLSFLVGVFPGIFLGTSLVSMVPSSMGKKFFGVFLLIIVFKNLFIKNKISNEQMQLEGRNLIKVISGFFAGLVAGLTGVGGGSVLVPVLISVFKLPAKLISPASNFMMIFTTGVAFMRFVFMQSTPSPVLQKFQIGQVNIFIIAVIFCGSFLSAKYGARINDLCDDKLKNKLFTALLLFISLKILFTS